MLSKLAARTNLLMKRSWKWNTISAMTIDNLRHFFFLSSYRTSQLPDTSKTFVRRKISKQSEPILQIDGFWLCEIALAEVHFVFYRYSKLHHISGCRSSNFLNFGAQHSMEDVTFLGACAKRKADFWLLISPWELLQLHFAIASRLFFVAASPVFDNCCSTFFSSFFAFARLWFQFAIWKSF